MRNILTIIGITSIILILGLFSCSNPTEHSNNKKTTVNTSNGATLDDANTSGMPVKITGNILGLQDGAKVFFDKKTSSAMEILASVLIQADGKFEINAKIDHPGIFRLRLGANYVWLILNGNEKIQIKANVTTSNINSLEIEGSEQSEELMAVLSNKPDPKAMGEYLDSRDKSQVLVNLFLVEGLNPRAYIKQYKAVSNQLASRYPDWSYTRDFSSKIALFEQQLNNQPIMIGSKVPEIRLKDPSGKDIALSSLKGKVVLLDFWASWCGPCRRENPNVVQVYDKYNAKGFEVFSVSLDGLDDRRVIAFQKKPELLKQQMDVQKQRWQKAIQEDKLKWSWHGSQLRGWSSPVAQQFGVRSIPKAFLIDRDGVIRYMDGLRGGGLEQKVKELL